MEKLNLTGKSGHGVDDSLKGLSALFVDGERIYIDNGAIHGKSQLERNLTFVKDPSELRDGREVWVFWITLHRFGGVQGYYGAMPFRLLVDEERKLGHKSLAEQVNKMDKAVKGNVDVAEIPVDIVRRVGTFLRDLRPDLWEHAGDSFRSAFAGDC